MKIIYTSICIFLMIIQSLSGQVTLSLDLEINESDNLVFYQLIDIATDSENNIYVLDRKEKRIYLFDEKGKFIKTMGRGGAGPGEFSGPKSIYIDSKKLIYVLDSGNNRVEIFRPEGSFIKSIKIVNFPTGGSINIVVDKDRNLYISGFFRESNSIFAKFAPDGKLLKYFPLQIKEYNGIQLNGMQRTHVNQWLAGGSACLDNKERIYFSYRWPHIIKVMTKEGNELLQLSGNTKLNWTPLIFRNDPTGLTFGSTTVTQKVFFINNCLLVNSISVVDWDGDNRKKVKAMDIVKNPSKYYKINGRFTLLEFFTKEGKLMDVAEIDGKIKFLASDKKGRIIGIKYDKENLQTIVRYKIEKEIK